MLEANPHLKPAIDEVAAKAGNAEAVTAVLTDRPGQVSPQASPAHPPLPANAMLSGILLPYPKSVELSIV